MVAIYVATHHGGTLDVGPLGRRPRCPHPHSPPATQFLRKSIMRPTPWDIWVDTLRATLRLGSITYISQPNINFVVGSLRKSLTKIVFRYISVGPVFGQMTGTAPCIRPHRIWTSRVGVYIQTLPTKRLWALLLQSHWYTWACIFTLHDKHLRILVVGCSKPLSSHPLRSIHSYSKKFSVKMCGLSIADVSMLSTCRQTPVDTICLCVKGDVSRSINVILRNRVSGTSSGSRPPKFDSERRPVWRLILIALGRTVSATRAGNVLLRMGNPIRELNLAHCSQPLHLASHHIFRIVSQFSHESQPSEWGLHHINALVLSKLDQQQQTSKQTKTLLQPRWLMPASWP